MLRASLKVLVVKNLPANARDSRDMGLIPGLGRSPGEGNGNPLQYSCLGKHMERGAWKAIVLGIARSQTWLCCSHVFRETHSLRRTMQIVECSLLHQHAQGRVSS